MLQQTVTFPGSTGAELSGVLHLPEQSARGSVLLAHCFTCSKDHRTMSRFGEGLATAGYAVLRFDFTGLGESGGDFTDSTVTNNVRDLAAAARTLIERGYGPCGLLGHSLGGTAALLATTKLKTVRSVVVINAPADPRHVTRLFAEKQDLIEDEGCAVVSIAGRQFPISREFIDDLGRHDTDGTLAKLECPLLVIHAVDDDVVHVSQGERIFQQATQPKAFLPLLSGGHLLAGHSAVEAATAMAVEWFDRTL